jgi:hypothetical protein
MAQTAPPAADAVIGRNPDQLTLEQRRELAGLWIALEIYRPETTPLRRIEALGSSVGECIATLKRRGLDPFQFEFTPLRPPY